MKLILYLLCLLFYCPSFAYSKEIPDSLKCMKAAQSIEDQQNIPSYILSAIALTESGRKAVINGENYSVSWPWTANIGGKGYYYKNKSEAIQSVQKAQKKNIKSIDVGCMQINLKYHPDAFSSLEDAFNPNKNMLYAAHFLKKLHKKTNDWSKTVSYYHSYTPQYHIVYKKNVIKNWDKAMKDMHPDIGKIAYLLSFYDPKNNPIDFTSEPEKPKLSSKNQKFYSQRQRYIASIRSQVRAR